MRILFALLAFIATISVTALAAEPEIDLKAGAWNITLQPQQPQAIPTVQMVCLTPKEPVPVPTVNTECRVLTKDVQGNTVYWVAECRDADTVSRSVGNATYSGTRVEGGVQTTIAAIDKAPEMQTYKLSGRRQGSCK